MTLRETACRFVHDWALGGLTCSQLGKHAKPCDALTALLEARDETYRTGYAAREVEAADMKRDADALRATLADVAGILRSENGTGAARVKALAEITRTPDERYHPPRFPPLPPPRRRPT